MFTIFVTLIIFLATLLFIFNWQKFRYWKTRGVPTPPYFPLIGHLDKMMFGYRWESIDKMYYKMKSNGFWGVYEWFIPTLYISDPALVREITIKEADSFMDRRVMKFSGDEDYFNEMLSTVQGQKWKSLRSLMTPTFTSGKIKAMFPLIIEKGDVLINECDKEMEENSFVEMKSLLGYYTLDAIASCAFGIDAKCLQMKEESNFVKCTSSVFNFNTLAVIKFMLLSTAPTLCSKLGIRFAGDLSFLANVVEKTIEIRNKTDAKRGDFLDLLLDAYKELQTKKDENKYPMTMKTITSESLLFIFAGFDTTGNALALTSYLLAKNEEEQKKLREELMKIIEVYGEFTYQNIMEAQYLEAFTSEALRLYPPAHFLERACTRQYKIPDTDLVVPEKMIVGIPVWSIHRDPEYWVDPLTFNPDRFMPENKANIKPYTYMPFGLGPRNCIAMRFAQMELKISIAKLCYTYELSLRPGYKELVLAKVLNTLRPDKEGVQLVLKKIDHN